MAEILSQVVWLRSVCSWDEKKKKERKNMGAGDKELRSNSSS